jgi:hypothetical protein
MSKWTEYLGPQTTDLPVEIPTVVTPEAAAAPPDVLPAESLGEMISEAVSAFQAANFLVEDELVRRFVASLLAKPFVILTGVSGSGKTKLAEMFSAWLCGDGAPSRYELVAVGADWTNNENIVGYPDALDRSRYVRTKTLDLVIRATKETSIPHFLILDEMNLSHVERYFADVLSALEANKRELTLHRDAVTEGEEPSAVRDGVPQSLIWPSNLFVVGTVNVDETTYMFSPKVLDRASVIEFSVPAGMLARYLESPKAIDPTQASGRGLKYATLFLAEARGAATIDATTRNQLRTELLLLQDTMVAYKMEFGLRVAREAARYLYFDRVLSGGTFAFGDSYDAILLQKLLTKLHGSGSRESLLRKLLIACHAPRVWRADGTLEAAALQALESSIAAVDDPSAEWSTPGEDTASYKRAFRKVSRMWQSATADGFFSYALG